MQFVDRHGELRRLKGVSGSRGGQLVVVWGRRRIGKTRLLLEWVRTAGGLYWVADESAAPIQRAGFAEALETRLPGFGQVQYPDWGALFARLARDALSAGWRGPLVIDELPYLVSTSPELPSVLQRFVDHAGRDAGLVMALAGSSQRMMQGLVLDKGAPLFGRAREVMKLQPIPAGHLGRALGLPNARAVIEAWALWGGVPRYWELAAAFPSMRDAVDALVLDPQGPLHDEPARLLLEETPPAVALRPLLDAIGAGAHRVSEIAGRIGQAATSLARPLARLQELDLVVRDAPFGEPERSGKRALYRLADPFLRLWFALVARRRSLLLQAPRKTRLALLAAAEPALRAAAWEILCRDAIPRLVARLGGIDYGPARRYWRGDGPEWDMIAESLDGRSLLVGEAKWTERHPTASALTEAARRLIAKGVPPVPRRPEARIIRYAIFVPRRPRPSRPLGRDVHVVDAADLLAVLRY
jgi:AAA+ ATPase superfamily predicted ATPase